MEKIQQYLGCIKPCEYWDKLPINWFGRILSINSSGIFTTNLGFFGQVEGLPRERIVVGGFGMGGALALKTAPWMGLQVPLVLFFGGRIGTRVGYRQFIKRPTSCRLVNPQVFGSE